MRTYEAVLDPGVSVKYYIDNVLVGTITTNIPASGGFNNIISIYVEGNDAIEPAGLDIVEISFLQE